MYAKLVVCSGSNEQVRIIDLEQDTVLQSDSNGKCTGILYDPLNRKTAQNARNGQEVVFLLRGNNLVKAYLQRVGDSPASLGSTRPIKKPARFETSPTTVPCRPSTVQRPKAKINPATAKLRAAAAAAHEKSILRKSKPGKENRVGACSSMPSTSTTSSRQPQNSIRALSLPPQLHVTSRSQVDSNDALFTMDESIEDDPAPIQGRGGRDLVEHTERPEVTPNPVQDDDESSSEIDDADIETVTVESSEGRRRFPLANLNRATTTMRATEPGSTLTRIQPSVPASTTQSSGGRGGTPLSASVRPAVSTTQSSGGRSGTPLSASVRPANSQLPTAPTLDRPALMQIASAVAAEVGGLVMTSMDNLRSDVGRLSDEVAVIRNERAAMSSANPADDGYVPLEILQPAAINYARGARTIGSRIVNIFRAHLPEGDSIHHYAVQETATRREISGDTLSSVLHYTIRMNRYLPMTAESNITLGYVKRKLGRGLYEHTPQRRGRVARRRDRHGAGGARRAPAQRNLQANGRLRGRARGAAAAAARVAAPAAAQGAAPLEAPAADDFVVAAEDEVPAPAQAAAADLGAPAPAQAAAADYVAPAPPQAAAADLVAPAPAQDPVEDLVQAPAQPAAPLGQPLAVFQLPRPVCIQCHTNAAYEVCNPCGHLLYCAPCLDERRRCGACRALLNHEPAALPGNAQQAPAAAAAPPAPAAAVAPLAPAAAVAPLAPAAAVAPPAPAAPVAPLAPAAAVAPPAPAAAVAPLAPAAAVAPPAPAAAVAPPAPVAAVPPPAPAAAVPPPAALNPALAPPTHNGIPLRGYEDRVCCVCTDPATHYLYPCLHSQFCGLCAWRLNDCPLCRAVIRNNYPRSDVIQE